MKITHYHTHQLGADDFKKYSGFVHVAFACKFYSQGKNGKFELRILISRFKHSQHMNSFNLGFGVWDEEFQDLDDIVETRNGDMQVILATVGHIALQFLQSNPSAELYAQGSTQTRTRLYQREIAKIIDQIPSELRIEGLVEKDAQGYIDFQRGINFDAFLLTVK